MKEEKKKDRGLLLAAGICVIVCLAVLGVLLLGDPILGQWERGRAISVLSAQEDTRVVLADPTTFGQELFSGAQVVLEEPEGEQIREALKTFLKESRFQRREAEVTGTWLPSVTVYTREEMTRVFLGEDALYLEKDGKRSVFEIPREQRASYGEFYKDVLRMLEEVQA